MASPFKCIHAPAVEIFPETGTGREEKGGKGKGRKGEGKEKGRKGMNGRGIDTFRR